jgi:hypothetical protein
MSIIEAGKYMQLLVAIVGASAGLYYLWRAIKGESLPLRMLPAVEAISDAVDRALEEGRPVFTGPAEISYLSGQYSAMTLSGVNIMRYTLRQCVRKGVRPIIPVPFTAEVMPLLDGVYREVCATEGKPEMYRSEDVVFFSTQPGVRAVGEMGMAEKLKPAASVQVGAFGGASSASLAAERAVGALLIGGTARYYHQGTLSVLCHYPLIMDEVYAAGALCSEDDVVKASLYGRDILKFFSVGIFLLFLILAALGMPSTDWLSL